MIELYTSATPNGQKIHIMLEEAGLPYRLHWVDLRKGEQFDPEFLKISPNNKIPVILDRDGPGGEPFSVFESGAILIYLAEKTGKFLPAEPRARTRVLEWLMFQVGGVGPMLGQAHHFRAYAREKIPYAIERYTNEGARIYRVLDKRLSEQEYLAGDYSIADMAVFPWIRLHERQGQDMADHPHLSRWFDAIEARPAVARDMDKTRTWSAPSPTRCGTISGERSSSSAGERPGAGLRAADRGAAVHGVALLGPAGHPLVQHLHVAVALLVENLESQPGQVAGALSIEDDEALLRDQVGTPVKGAERYGDGPLDVFLGVAARLPDVHDEQRLAVEDVLDQLLDVDVLDLDVLGRLHLGVFRVLPGVAPGRRRCRQEQGRQRGREAKHQPPCLSGALTPP